MNILTSKWGRFGLQRRIMAYVTVGLLVLFSGIAYFEMRAVRDLKDQIFRERIALAEVLAGRVEKNFEFLSSDLLLIAEQVRSPEKDFGLAAGQIFDSLKQHAPSQFFAVSSIQILDDRGQLLGSRPEGTKHVSPAITEAVQSTLAGMEPLIFPCPNPAPGNTLFALVAVPVSPSRSGGRPVVVVAETVGTSGNLPAIPGGGSDYSIEILGADGRIIVSSSELDKAGAISPHYADLRQHIEAGQPAVDILPGHEPARGDDLVVAVTPFQSSSFFLVLEQPADIALMVPRRLHDELFAVATVALVLAAFIAWHTTKRIVRPVKELGATARMFAMGNLDNPVRVSAQDEIRELADDIEAMRQQLKTSRDDIQQAKLELEMKVAERTQRLQETLGKIFTAEEEERRRLARELHDEQIQALGALSVSLDRVSRLLGQSSSEIRAEIQQARDMARSLLKETRRLIYDLRPSVLDDMGLEAAIQWCAETHLESKGVHFVLHNSLNPHRRLPGAIEVALFRVAQEAIVNIARHSQARHAAVVIEHHDAGLRMQVSDDGKGLVSRSGAGGKNGGVGMEGMRERIRLLGGTVDVYSEPGKGTLISLEVPLDLDKEALS